MQRLENLRKKIRNTADKVPVVSGALKQRDEHLQRKEKEKQHKKDIEQIDRFVVKLNETLRTIINLTGQSTGCFAEAEITRTGTNAYRVKYGDVSLFIDYAQKNLTRLSLFFLLTLQPSLL